MKIKLEALNIRGRKKNSRTIKRELREGGRKKGGKVRENTSLVSVAALKH